MKDFVKHMKNNIAGEAGSFRLCQSYRFGDTGHSLSIQASGGHYCTPRKMVALDEYTHFEIMTNIPVEDIPESWSKYGDINDVFRWVPKEEIEKLINTLNEKYCVVS